ncbi:MAG: 2-aminoethylphosphonate--pyruvate transaminase [Desulfobacterales bacterium]|jgi:2-aminoethylphosphonate-pyruvate transaminase
MDKKIAPSNPYILLTPGPLSTTLTVKQAMLRDWCTWDDDYKQIIQDMRRKLVDLASRDDGYSCVLMQGSGTFCVESVITTAVPDGSKLLVLANGAYGRRIALIAERIGIDVMVHDSGDTSVPDLEKLEQILSVDAAISHVAVVHCETTTGMLNPIESIGRMVKARAKVFIVDAMSSFGGIPLDAHEVGADYLISSANKCIQGVPGFGFVIARRAELAQTRGQARSMSLDLFDQWETMEKDAGKWRFTSPTHTVRAFAQALQELEMEGGITSRYERYCENHRLLVQGMQALGFKTLLPAENQSPIITAFHSPDHKDWAFDRFYRRLKQKGFVIYPGKVTEADTFRIGNIGDIQPADITRLLQAVKSAMYWRRDGAQNV